MEPLQESVIDDIEQRMWLQPVSTGTRFANYLIDSVVFYTIYIVFMMLLGIVMATNGQDAQQINDFVNSSEFQIYNFIIVYIMYTLVYTLIEGATKGRTLGKLITGTKAVRENGDKISWKDALLRSLSRIVPFEVFSGLSGYPWHDKWTNTIVVKNRR